MVRITISKILTDVVATPGELAVMTDAQIKELCEEDMSVVLEGAEWKIEHGARVKRFVRPSLEEVRKYCAARGAGINPEQWFDHYSANGWRVGKSPMVDWKAAVRTWEHSGFNGNGAKRVPDCSDADSPAAKIRKQQADYLQKKASR